jgi:uncharacterized membrane protein YkgB
MLKQILWGLLLIPTGVGLVVYCRKLVEWFGRSATAEKYLGYGGTYTGLRILGIFLVIIGILIATGFLNTALVGILRGIGLVK